MEGDKEVAEKAQRKKMKRGQSEVERERERWDSKNEGYM